jgi:hypothetical protein
MEEKKVQQRGAAADDRHALPAIGHLSDDHLMGTR